MQNLEIVYNLFNFLMSNIIYFSNQLIKLIFLNKKNFFKSSLNE